MAAVLLESMASQVYRPRVKNLICYLQVMSVCALLWATPSFAGLQRFRHPIVKNGSLSFLAVGDWGRNGHYNQSKVAYQMGRIGKRLDIDFVISTGDNFYDNGLQTVFDSSFRNSFKNIYTAESLRKKWYSVLGNHDYRGDVAAQLSPILRIFDKRWLCLRSFILNTEIVEFFFVDTTPFVDKYFVKRGQKHVYDWRGVLPRKAYLDRLLKNVESSLTKSSATWKIVVGHHTIKSAGHHGDTPELVKHLLPILKDNNVDFYINGHDHCLEHITSIDGSTEYLTSGGGSKAWRGDIKHRCDHSLKFYHDGQGFLSMEMNETDAVFAFYDVYGQTLHQTKKSKPLHSAE